MRRVAVLCLVANVLTPAAGAAAQAPEAAPTQVDVRIDPGEAEAVLAILRARRAGHTSTSDDWTRLYEAAGYRALARRQRAMGTTFTDDRFRAFVESDSLLRRLPDLEPTVAAWDNMDVDGASRRALAYLPEGTPLHAVVFLEIKPHTNSFVFELDGTRAIYLYVDPDESRGQIENIVAHELHHTGVAAACSASEDSTLPQPVRDTRQWMTAFGEGRAMLAAAGGPDIHPHALDDSATKARWDRDVSHFNRDLARVQEFFFDVLHGTIAADSARAAGFSFFGVQGPWYTVGWKMAVTVEHTYGRARLVATTCDPVAFLTDYNRAIASDGNPEGLATWSPDLLRRARAEAARR